MTVLIEESPGDVPETVRRIVERQTTFIDITTPSTAGNELEVRHTLGRTPIGFSIVKAPYQASAWWSGDGDTDWDDTSMWLKFSVTDVDMTIGVY